MTAQIGIDILTRVITGQRDVAVGVPALRAPLGAEEDEVYLGAAGGDADPAGAAAVAEVIGRRCRGGARGARSSRMLPRPGRHLGGGSPRGHRSVPVGVVIGRSVGVGDGRIRGGGRRHHARLRRGGGRLRPGGRQQDTGARQRDQGGGAAGGPSPGMGTEAHILPFVIPGTPGRGPRSTTGRETAEWAAAVAEA